MATKTDWLILVSQIGKQIADVCTVNYKPTQLYKVYQALKPYTDA